MCTMSKGHGYAQLLELFNLLVLVEILGIQKVDNSSFACTARFVLQRLKNNLQALDFCAAEIQLSCQRALEYVRRISLQRVPYR